MTDLNAPTETLRDRLRRTLDEIEATGLLKAEHRLQSPQEARIILPGADGERGVLNLCANNYLGLSDHPEIVAAAHEALDRWGFGLSSVRFICGTQELHKALEEAVSRFLGMEDTILYAACFDANGGVFEPLLGPEDAIVSDALNHASLIDGIRLCKAHRYRYASADLEDLEAKLKEARDAEAREIVIATDGVFSMDGVIAPLDGICALAERYEARVLVDDCHATGFLGEGGRRSHEHCGVLDKVDLLTGTFGKALGGASGGYVSGPKEIIELLRQRSRPYLFSNSLAPAICAGSLRALQLVESGSELRDRLWSNTRYYRRRLAEEGLSTSEGLHPITPIMLGEASLAQEVSSWLLEEKGILAVGFFFPVVPQGKARIRTQVSAAHSEEDLEEAVQAFAAARQRFRF